MLNMFGWMFGRKGNEESDKSGYIEEIETRRDADAIQTINSVGYAFDATGYDKLKTDIDIIRKSRELSMNHIVDMAIRNIVDEAIVYDDRESLPIKLVISEELFKSYCKSTAKPLKAAFDKITKLYDVRNSLHDKFRSWYIDGRQYYQVIIDRDNPKEGIKDLIKLDSANIKKIVNIKKKDVNGLQVTESIEEYYIYKKDGFQITETNVATKITPESIIMVTSGKPDHYNRIVPYLYSAFIPYNQLRMMETANIIHVLARAPQRRIFYIDVGGASRAKAEQVIDESMARYKNRQVYDAATGAVKDDKLHSTILDDIYLPRTGDRKTTEITTLDSSSSLLTMDNVEYFKDRLFESLNVPISRMRPGQSVYSPGRSGEIARDEIAFSKFINTLRKRFSDIFIHAMKIELVLTGVCTEEEFDNEIRHMLSIDYIQDNVYSQFKDLELEQFRFSAVQNVAYMMENKLMARDTAREYVLKKVFAFTDEQLDENAELLKKQEEEDFLQQQYEAGYSPDNQQDSPDNTDTGDIEEPPKPDAPIEKKAAPTPKRQAQKKAITPPTQPAVKQTTKQAVKPTTVKPTTIKSVQSTTKINK